MVDRDSPHLPLPDHYGSASGAPRTFFEFNICLGAMFPYFKERSTQKGSTKGSPWTIFENYSSSGSAGIISEKYGISGSAGQPTPPPQDGELIQPKARGNTPSGRLPAEQVIITSDDKPIWTVTSSFLGDFDRTMVAADESPPSTSVGNLRS